MSVEDTIREKLERAFDPVRLDIVDDSHRHAGHVGARDGGETHFNVEIVTTRFEGLSRVERQRQVYAALSEEMGAPIHALSIRALTPQES